MTIAWRVGKFECKFWCCVPRKVENLCLGISSIDEMNPNRTSRHLTLS